MGSYVLVAHTRTSGTRIRRHGPFWQRLDAACIFRSCDLGLEDSRLQPGEVLL